MSITCGVDWAEGHHDVAVVDDGGHVLARRRIGVGVAGFTELLDLLTHLSGTDPATWLFGSAGG